MPKSRQAVRASLSQARSVIISPLPTTGRNKGQSNLCAYRHEGSQGESDGGKWLASLDGACATSDTSDSGIIAEFWIHRFRFRFLSENHARIPVSTWRSGWVTSTPVSKKPIVVPGSPFNPYPFVRSQTRGRARVCGTVVSMRSSRGLSYSMIQEVHPPIPGQSCNVPGGTCSAYP